MHQAPLSRRSFVKVSAAAAASLPAISWARVLGANERVNMAVIGTGGMGTSHLHSLVGMAGAENIAVTRVCDVYQRRLNNAVRVIKGDESSGTMYYERVLDDKSVDAVLIATPDHWHTKIAIEAMEAGKDVYCEKPLSLTIEQAIECRNAAKRLRKVLQVGPQGTSEDRWWKAREAIAAGRIGKVVWSQGGYCRNSREGQFNWGIDADAGPHAVGEGHVWWDRWLGHDWGLAPKIGWNADHFFRFRKYWAYNGGVATDLLYHKLAPLLLAITGPNGEYPLRVNASGGQYVEKDGRDIPDTFIMTADYPSEHTVVLASVMVNDTGLSDMIRGQHAQMEPAGAGWKVREQSAWWPEFRRNNAEFVTHAMTTNDKGQEVPDPRPGAATFDLPAGERRGHMQNFIDAVRGDAKPHCNIDLGCSTMVAIKMAVEAYRKGKTMVWDAKRERARPA